jgi:ribosomal protein L37AE/L43A
VPHTVQTIAVTVKSLDACKTCTLQQVDRFRPVIWSKRLLRVPQNSGAAATVKQLDPE